MQIQDCAKMSIMYHKCKNLNTVDLCDFTIREFFNDFVKHQHAHVYLKIQLCTVDKLCIQVYNTEHWKTKETVEVVVTMPVLFGVYEKKIK